MAAVARTPFAPLDSARLQNITSLKNRQNAVSFSPATKRKATESLDTDDSENVDPLQFGKRPKGDGSVFSNDIFKPSKFVFTKAMSTPSLSNLDATPAPAPMRDIARPRSILNPKSPAAKLNSNGITKKTPLFAAPAPRSPPRGTKRLGLLSNRRRTLGAMTRIDPPSSLSSSPAPFSLDAALRGTVPSYMSRPSRSTSSRRSLASDLGLEPEIKSSWVFDIHEDTPEQEMTNLLQHSTCVLDISSDEESERKARAMEMQDKENVPPADDVSQTSTAPRRSARNVVSEGGMEYEKPRAALGVLRVEDFYEEGCDAGTVVIVPADEEGEAVVEGDDVAKEAVLEEVVVAEDVVEHVLEPEQAIVDPENVPLPLKDVDVDALLRGDDVSKAAAILKPIEGTGESFEMWESGSAKDDAEVPRERSESPTPRSPASETTGILNADLF